MSALSQQVKFLFTKTQSLWDVLASRGRHWALFVFAFGLSKGSVFVAPLFLSNLLSRQSYGTVEYALALGGLLASVLSLGAPGAYAYFVLKRQSTPHQIALSYHPLLALSVLLIGLGTLALGLIHTKTFLALLIATVISLQQLWSVLCKTEGRISAATLTEGGLYLLFGLLGLLLWLHGGLSQQPLLFALLSAWLLLLLSRFGLRLLRHKTPFSWHRTKEILAFGAPLFLSSCLMLCLTASGRLLIEAFFTLEDVGIYSFYFRIAAVVVLLHAFLNTALFKKLYAAAPETLDQAFSAFLSLILLCGLLSFWLLPSLCGSWFSIMRETLAQQRLLYLTLVFQMCYWIGMALNENILYREQLSPKFNRGLLALVAFFLGLILLFHLFDALTLLRLVQLHMFCMFLGTELQGSLFRNKQFFFPKTRCFHQASLLLYFALCFFSKFT